MDKITELENRIKKLEEVVTQLVANETNRQIQQMQEFEELRDAAMSEIGHDM